MDDLISRQAAIDAVCMEWCNVKHQDCKHPFDVEKDDYYWCDGCETVLRTLPDLPSAPERKTGEWIPVTERLPEEAYPVIVTWKNDDPASYYQYVLGKHYVGVAHYKNGKWFWYSSITEDVLMEYGRCDSEEFDEAIKVLAWMPLPEPYKEEQDG